LLPCSTCESERPNGICEWSGRRDSNPRSPGPEPGAIPGFDTSRNNTSTFRAPCSILAITRSRTECPTGLSSVLPNDGPALHRVATLSRPRSSSCHRGADLARTSSKPRHDRLRLNRQLNSASGVAQIWRWWVQIWVRSTDFYNDLTQPVPSGTRRKPAWIPDQQPSGNSQVRSWRARIAILLGKWLLRLDSNQQPSG
jgi:hypothetical protein